MPDPQSLIPTILVSNDDGVSAEGIAVLENIAKKLSSDVWVVAPELEQSGASHSLTLHAPVRLRQRDERHFAVSGTPTDCVLLALKQVLRGKKVDLVLSGINKGSNAADDITYSGTVAAAMEATILEVPAIALSQLTDDGEFVRWDTAEHFAEGVIRKLLSQGWPQDTLINVNFPNCAPDEVKGVRVCPQGKRRVSVNLTGRVDLKNRPYYWLGGERDNTAVKPGVDVEFLHAGYITVTPISMDMTDRATMDRISAAF
jgi:5'-nucleotidase